MDPASARFPAGAKLPQFHDIPVLRTLFAKVGPDGAPKLSAGGLPTYEQVPANVTFFVALVACLLVWVLIWRTRLGYEIRAFGKSQAAAAYAGISAVKVTMIAMLISGGLAGMMAINNVMGDSDRLLQNSSEGAGFIGIAVALMGRSHPLRRVPRRDPVRVPLSGRGRARLGPRSRIELRIVVQALVILFTGALDKMVRMLLGVFFRPRRQAVA